MKTYEEAEAAILFRQTGSEGVGAVVEKLAPYKSLRDEIKSSPMTGGILLAGVMTAMERDLESALAAILQLGILIGIEMEKQEL